MIDEQKFFHEGLDLFNSGEFFEAHEIWEDIWHLAGGPRKRFYQGLIQAAVTLEDVRRGNPRGVKNVYTSMLTKFTGLPDVYMGVRIPKLLADLKQTLQPLFNMPEDTFAPGRYSAGKGVEIPIDLANAPRITLEYDPFDEQRG